MTISTPSKRGLILTIIILLHLQGYLESCTLSISILETKMPNHQTGSLNIPLRNGEMRKGLYKNFEGLGTCWHSSSSHPEAVIHLNDVLELSLPFHLSESFLQLVTSKRHSCIAGPHLKELTEKNIFHLYRYIFQIWLTSERARRLMKVFLLHYRIGTTSNQKTQQVFLYDWWSLAEFLPSWNAREYASHVREIFNGVL